MQKEVTLESISHLLDTKLDSKFAAFRLELQKDFVTRVEMNEYFNAIEERFGQIDKRFDRIEDIVRVQGGRIGIVEQRVSILER
jgi:hypothetical protein